MRYGKIIPESTFAMSHRLKDIASYRKVVILIFVSYVSFSLTGMLKVFILLRLEYKIEKNSISLTSLMANPTKRYLYSLK